MHTIELKKQIRIWPFRFTIPWTRKIQAPSEWNEITHTQGIAIYKAMEKAATFYELNCLYTMAMLGLSIKQFLAFTTEQVIQLNQLFTWINAGNELTKNPVKCISVLKLCTPLDDFEEMTAEEWIVADHYYREITGPDINQLADFVAVIYRPKRKDFNYKIHRDCRQPFSIASHKFHARWIKKYVDVYTMLLIKQWYEATRFKHDETFWRVFSESTKAEAENYGWGETMLKMTGPAFGTLAEVEQQPVKNVFLKMQIDLKDFEEQKRKQPKP